MILVGQGCDGKAGGGERAVISQVGRGPRW